MGTNQTINASQASEQRYRHLFKNLPICIFVADLTVNPAIILEVNRQTELVYGYTAAELVGNPSTQLALNLSRVKHLLRVQRQIVTRPPTVS
jgi:PAS domain S-box-containing protein